MKGRPGELAGAWDGVQSLPLSIPPPPAPCQHRPVLALTKHHRGFAPSASTHSTSPCTSVSRMGAASWRKSTVAAAWGVGGGAGLGVCVRVKRGGARGVLPVGARACCRVGRVVQHTSEPHSTLTSAPYTSTKPPAAAAAAAAVAAFLRRRFRCLEVSWPVRPSSPGDEK